jgi:hypothetical protein
MSEADAQQQLDAMLDNLFQTSQWHHTDNYSGCDFPATTHYYFDSSWDLAYESAHATSQCKHEE